MASRLGKPVPQAMDKVVVVERHSLAAVEAEEVKFTTAGDNVEASFKMSWLSAEGQLLLRLRKNPRVVRRGMQPDAVGPAFAEEDRVVVVDWLQATADGVVQLPNAGINLRIPAEDRMDLLPKLRFLCQEGTARLEMPDDIVLRKTVTDPDQVKEQFTKWVDATAHSAFGPNHEGKPESVDEASQWYTTWMERARIPRASPETRALAVHMLMRPLERREFDKHINKRAGMAAGLDGCTWEMLQHLPDTAENDAKSRIFVTLRSFYAKGYDKDTHTWPRFPKWFGDAWTSPIPKARFDYTTDRCRGITVTPALGRLLCKIVNSRLVDYIEQRGCLCNAQQGFRRGRSTLNCVAKLEAYFNGRKRHALPVDMLRGRAWAFREK
jgi:hypothetical protein